MRAPPPLRGGLAARVSVLLGGLFLFACGIVALLESGLGLAPWDVLHEGIAHQTPLSFGVANVVVSVVVVTLAAVLGADLGAGTVANAVLVGAFVEILTAVDVLDLADGPLPHRVGLLVLGLVLMGAGTGLYLGADLGAGPRDSLMVVGARRTPFRIGAVRATLEIAVLGAGFALGGTVGVGTVIFALGIGPSVELSFWLLARSPLARGGQDGLRYPQDDRHLVARELLVDHYEVIEPRESG